MSKSWKLFYQLSIDNCRNKLCPFKHSLIQIEEENYACEECNFTSRKSEDLNNHIRSSHTDFQCDLCEFKSKEEKTMEEHTKSNHKYEKMSGRDKFEVQEMICDNFSYWMRMLAQVLEQ